MVEHKGQTAAMISWRREFLTARRYTLSRYAAARLLRKAANPFLAGMRHGVQVGWATSPPPHRS